MLTEIDNGQCIIQLNWWFSFYAAVCIVVNMFVVCCFGAFLLKGKTPITYPVIFSMCRFQYLHIA